MFEILHDKIFSQGDFRTWFDKNMRWTHAPHPEGAFDHTDPKKKNRACSPIPCLCPSQHTFNQSHDLMMFYETEEPR